MLFKPFPHEVGNLRIVLLLEHEVAVAEDLFLGQIDDRRVASVGIILLGEVAALLKVFVTRRDWLTQFNRFKSR
ncbi:MAG: hypothetical protein J6M37_00540 [Prevotella sp.]|nr:hypothetical protein [Prevotella sp.]